MHNLHCLWFECFPASSPRFLDFLADQVLVHEMAAGEMVVVQTEETAAATELGRVLAINSGGDVWRCEREAEQWRSAAEGEARSSTSGDIERKAREEVTREAKAETKEKVQGRSRSWVGRWWGAHVRAGSRC